MEHGAVKECMVLVLTDLEVEQYGVGLITLQLVHCVYLTLSYCTCVPRVRTCFGSRGFSVAAPTIWNSLPLE